MQRWFFQHRSGFWERVDEDWLMVGRQETVIAREVTEYGEELEMGDGSVRLFLTYDPATRKPAAFGVQWDTTWDSLPPMPAPLPPDGPGEWSWVPEMPGIATELLPVDHVSFDWNPHGHPPPGIFDVPHVDVHFYLISREQRDEITPGSCPDAPFPVNCEILERARSPLPPEAQPPRNTMLGSVIPFMGLHLLDPEADEFQGLPFTNTFIFGQFDQRLIFIEPMITVDHFDGLTESDCRPIANPERFAEAGWYPTTYCARNNDGVLSVTLEDFQWYKAVDN